MKRAILMVAAACAATVLISLDADARRLGGGKTVGAPRDVATQRQALPPTAAPTPASPAGAMPAAAAAKGPLPTPAAAPSGWRRFMGPIAGIAAGLGIAALMSHLGMGEAFGNFLMIALMAIAVIVVLRLLFRRKVAPDQRQELQYAGAEPVPAAAGASAGGGFGSGSAAAPTPMFGGGSSAIAAAPDTTKFPPGFEPEPFLQQAKMNFARLQAAYDSGDTEVLRDVMTPEMFVEISRDLSARGTHSATDIVRLNAEILEVVTDSDYHWATVRFHGLTREDGVETPAPFNEAWNLKKAVDGSTGWLLSGIQQL